MIKIALDMMGGDNAPSSNIGGFVEFLSESDNSVKIYLVGNFVMTFLIVMIRKQNLQSQVLNLDKCLVMTLL